MNKSFFSVLLACMSVVTMFAVGKTSEIWSIGKKDGRADEFALAPDRFRDFLSKDFGYEDKYYLIGESAIEADFPYVLPGPVDTWGGTWPTSGWRTHQVTVLFDLEGEPKKDGYALELDLVDYAKNFLPLVKVSVNSQDAKFQLAAEG